jgi:hypothetical protein
MGIHAAVAVVEKNKKGKGGRSGQDTPDRTVDFHRTAGVSGSDGNDRQLRY